MPSGRRNLAQVTHFLEIRFGTNRYAKGRIRNQAHLFGAWRLVYQISLHRVGCKIHIIFVKPFSRSSKALYSRILLFSTLAGCLNFWHFFSSRTSSFLAVLAVGRTCATLCPSHIDIDIIHSAHHV